MSSALSSLELFLAARAAFAAAFGACSSSSSGFEDKLDVCENADGFADLASSFVALVCSVKLSSSATEISEAEESEEESLFCDFAVTFTAAGGLCLGSSPLFGELSGEAVASALFREGFVVELL